MKDGYFNWLEQNGVQKIIEDAVGPNKSKAVNAYAFKDEQSALAFKNKYLDNSSSCTVSFDKRIQSYVVTVDDQAHQSLKTQYLTTLSPMTIAECESQIAAIRKAQEKLLHNGDAQVARHGPEKITEDRIGYMALLLTNQRESMWFSMAASAVDIAFSVYKALNYQIFTEQEIELLNTAQNALLEVDNHGRIIGGLKADANFVEYIYREYCDETHRETRRLIIRENVELILNGGDHLIIDQDTPESIQSIKPKPTDPTARQKRFFPDQSGNSEIDEIVLQGGGMNQHSSMRILKKEKDPKTPGGYKYFYTKADAGGGAEEAKGTHDLSTGMTTGVYTTEIKPYFKLQEINKITQNPELYNEYMYATLFALLDAERQIMFYKNPKLAVDHGESKGLIKGDSYEWNFWNNKITILRGAKVAERCQESTLQQVGNCAVFSGMLAIQALIGQNRGNDMMQSFKTYNKDIVQFNLSNKLQEVRALKAKLEKAEKETLQTELATLSPTNKQIIIYPVNPEKIQCTLAIHFSSQEIKEQFRTHMIEFARQRKVYLHSIFGDDDTNHNILYIKASDRSYNEQKTMQDSLGAYVSLNKEVAVNFGKDSIAEEFKKLTGITNQAWVAMCSNTLYFEKEELPPIHEHRILTTLSPIPMPEPELKPTPEPEPAPWPISLQLLLNCVKSATTGVIMGTGINLFRFAFFSTSASTSLVASFTSPIGIGIVVVSALVSTYFTLHEQKPDGITGGQHKA